MGHSRLQQKKKLTKKEKEEKYCVLVKCSMRPTGRRETRTALTERLEDLHVDIK